jgi:hypothetical protein
MEKKETGKYFKYAIGEIILVVLGILIALLISDWNSGRLDENRNKELLRKLSKELDLNIERSNLLIRSEDNVFRARYRYTDSILKLLESKPEKEALNYMTSKEIFFVNAFNLNSSVFQQLKNSSRLYTVGSDSLVTEIQLYYQLCDRDSFYNLSYSQIALDFEKECNIGWNDFKYMYLKNPGKALKYHKWIFDSRSENFIYFRQYVNFANGHSALMLKKLTKIINESKKLKKRIAQELETL